MNCPLPEDKAMRRRHGTFFIGRLVPISVVIVALCAEAIAGQGVRRLMFWRGRWPETLIITGNYARPRLLAEQAQRETDLPVIVVSRESQGEEIYYLPAQPEAMQIPAEDYLEFIEVMIRPQRIVVLGDESFISAQYVDVLRERYPTIILSGKDWVTNAEQLGKIVGRRGLKRHYHKRLQELIEAEAHRTTAGPDQTFRN